MRLVCVVVAAVAVGCHPPGYGKDDAVDAAVDGGAAVDGPAVVDAGPDGAAVQCEGTFRLEGHGSDASVWLTGDFVAWAGTTADGAVALTLGGDGVWTGARTFDAGSYQYKFIIDGAAWIVDPGNPETVDDGFGGSNSVYVCE